MNDEQVDRIMNETYIRMDIEFYRQKIMGTRDDIKGLKYQLTYHELMKEQLEELRGKQHCPTCHHEIDNACIEELIKHANEEIERLTKIIHFAETCIQKIAKFEWDRDLDPTMDEKKLRAELKTYYHDYFSIHDTLTGWSWNDD